MLKLSNCSTCRYIRSDLGPLGTKYVSLFAKCRSSRCRYTRRILCGSKWTKPFGQEINVIISDMSLYPMSLYPLYLKVLSGIFNAILHLPLCLLSFCSQIFTTNPDEAKTQTPGGPLCVIFKFLPKQYHRNC